MKPAAVKLVSFAVALVFLTATLWLAAQFWNDAWDRRWLLWFNPDNRMPLLDALVLVVTKVTMPLALILLLLWLAGYGLEHRRLVSRPTLTWVLRAIGLMLAVGLASSPYWYRDRDMVYVYYAGALLIPIAMEIVVCSLMRSDRATLERLQRILLTAVAAVVLTYLVRNAIAHGLAPRHRPLSDINADWNGALRRIGDEEVRRGSSYVSGHASTVFALVTVLVWYVRVRAVQASLVLWALLMAYSRVYVAAHYPYCVIMGAALGVGAGVLTSAILNPATVGDSSTASQRR